MISEIVMEQRDFEVVFHVDHDKLKDADLHTINQFFSGDERRLKIYDNNVLYAVLSLIASTILSQSANNICNSVQGVINDFDWDRPGGGQEGLPKIDGTHGIKLHDFDVVEFDCDEFFVQERETNRAI